jgi:hypothetical protein
LSQIIFNKKKGKTKQRLFQRKLLYLYLFNNNCIILNRVIYFWILSKKKASV